MNRAAYARLLLVVAASSVAVAGNAVYATIIPKPFNSMTSSPPSLSTVNSITIANNGAPLGSRVYFGTLDLTNNDLIVHATNEVTALANLANVVDMVRSGFDHGDWLGTGITSSKAAADHASGYESTAVGVILNDDGSGNPLWGGANSLLGSFDGDSALSQFDLIVKYTFFGDTLLRGIVDGTDLTIVEGGQASAMKGWINGEFNYTGGTVSNLDVLETQRTLTYEPR